MQLNLYIKSSIDQVMATKIIVDMAIEKGVETVSKLQKVPLLKAIKEALYQKGHTFYNDLDIKALTKDAKLAKEADTLAKEMVGKQLQKEFK